MNLNQDSGQQNEKEGKELEKYLSLLVLTLINFSVIITVQQCDFLF